MKRFALYIIAILALTACGSDSENSSSTSENTNANVVTTIPEVTRLEFPKVKGGNSIVIVHKTSDAYDNVNYSLEWDCDKKSQRWSCYEMHKGFGGSATRSNNFIEDPDLPSYARVDDSYSYYKSSEFHRGHICPSADRKYSSAANQQTFYYTNMQPQYYNFNGGDEIKSMWYVMENQVRVWANSTGCDTLYVCKGGTIDNEDQILTRIKGTLIVPKYFFCALLMKNSLGYKALGLWFEHTSTVSASATLADCVKSIDELEELTGIDFFCNLPDDIERKVEANSHENMINAWGL